MVCPVSGMNIKPVLKKALLAHADTGGLTKFVMFSPDFQQEPNRCFLLYFKHTRLRTTGLLNEFFSETYSELH
jgi:hypothetical protein